MTAISNGLAHCGGFIPYDATFLVFSDYARNAVRMSALMGAHAIHVYTHDSIGLGEDGPTHQPVEHLASLRYIPNNDVWRPCDAVESAMAWKAAIERKDGPSPGVLAADAAAPAARRRPVAGHRARGYVLKDSSGGPDHPDRDRVRSRAGDGCGEASATRCAWCRCLRPTCSTGRTRRIANRCCRRPCRKRVAIEAGVTDFWRKYVGLDGAVVGIGSLRRVRANRGADAAFRIHRRAGGGGGEVALIDPSSRHQKRRSGRRFRWRRYGRVGPDLFPLFRNNGNMENDSRLTALAASAMIPARAFRRLVEAGSNGHAGGRAP